MLYIIKIIDDSTNNEDDIMSENYIHYRGNKGFYLGTSLFATSFSKDMIETDKQLLEYLSDKKYKIEECLNEIDLFKYKYRT